MDQPRLRARTELAVTRGREASDRIQDEVWNLKAKGHSVQSVSINRECADNMKAYFESFLRLADGVLPKHVHGVPLFLDLTGTKHFEVRYRRRH